MEVAPVVVEPVEAGLHGLPFDVHERAGAGCAGLTLGIGHLQVQGMQTFRQLADVNLLQTTDSAEAQGVALVAVEPVVGRRGGQGFYVHEGAGQRGAPALLVSGHLQVQGVQTLAEALRVEGDAAGGRGRGARLRRAVVLVYPVAVAVGCLATGHAVQAKRNE